MVKHSILSLILQALKKKEKPFRVIDTHAGAGLYDLGSEWALQTQEFRQGIGLLRPKYRDFPQLQDYWDCLGNLNPPERLEYYPGSGKIILDSLRPQDRLTLMELHPSEVENLKKNLGKDSRVSVHHRDWEEGLKALVPVPERRGLVLVDPAYELKTDYDGVIQTLTKAWKKWETGIYALWYPLIRGDGRSLSMVEELSDSGFKTFLDARIILSDPSEGEMGLYGSGMFIINPPYRLDLLIKEILPKMAQVLSPEGRSELHVSESQEH